MFWGVGALCMEVPDFEFGRRVLPIVSCCMFIIQVQSPHIFSMFLDTVMPQAQITHKSDRPSSINQSEVTGLRFVRAGLWPDPLLG